MCGAIGIVQRNVGQSIAGRTESPICNTLIQAGFEQLSQESTVSVRMRIIESALLYTTLSHSNERSSLSVSAEDGAKRVLEVTTEKDTVLLRLGNYKGSEKNLEQKPSNQDFILKAMKSLFRSRKMVSSVK